MTQKINKTKSKSSNGKHLLQVDDLSVHFFTRRGVAQAVDGVSFHLDEGESLGIVGESGSGKSVTALGMLRLVPPPGQIVGGTVQLDGDTLTELSGQEMRKVRGSKISMILQDPMTSLNPSFAIGAQVSEAIEIHHGLKGKSLKDRVVEMLRMVRIPAAESRVQDFPHQLSGGMRQRASGAIGISCAPKVLICDEPTTALDMTIQAQYLELLKDVQKETGVAFIFITHDMGIVAKMCDRVVVMYAGRIVEAGPVIDVFRKPSHPYTISLLKCLPRLTAVDRLESIDGQPPDPHVFPKGCRFAPRCPKAQKLCHEEYPETTVVKGDHINACHFPGDWN